MYTYTHPDLLNDNETPCEKYIRQFHIGALHTLDVFTRQCNNEIVSKIITKRSRNLPQDFPDSIPLSYVK